MDRYGLDIFLPTEQRNATVLALLERGYAERMFLSQDFTPSRRSTGTRPRSIEQLEAAGGADGLEHDLALRAGDPGAEGGAG